MTLGIMIIIIILFDKNISTKEFDKLSKYKDLEIEIAKMWHLNTTTILGVLGMVKKNSDIQIKKIFGNPSLFEIQKIVSNEHSSYTLKDSLNQTYSITSSEKKISF